MSSGPQLVRAEGVVHDRILAATHSLWSDGLTPERYAQYNRAQMRTRWGSRHLARLALVDGDEVLTSAKRYDLEVVLDGRSTRAVGIGAVFTPPEHRRNGYASRIVTEMLDRASAEGVSAALLFSEIGTPFYERHGFTRVPLVPSEVRLRPFSGAPAVAMRTGEEADLPVIAEIHAARARGYRFAVRYDADWLQYSIAKRRLLAGLGPFDARRFEFLVAEEGGRAVAWVMLHAERGGSGDAAGGERWTLESCGDRDPEGARIGALLQAMTARAPAGPLPQIAAWWPERLDPPQISRRPLSASPIVMMIRSLGADPRIHPPLAAEDVLYWHLDAF
jgi:predicted N-acetyltransferase YhbS